MKTITDETCKACEGVRYMATGDPGDRLRPCRVCEGTGKVLGVPTWPEPRKSCDWLPKIGQRVLGRLSYGWTTVEFSGRSLNCMWTGDDGTEYPASEIAKWLPIPGDDA